MGLKVTVMAEALAFPEKDTAIPRNGVLLLYRIFWAGPLIRARAVLRGIQTTPCQFRCQADPCRIPEARRALLLPLPYAVLSISESLMLRESGLDVSFRSVFVFFSVHSNSR